MLTKIIKKGLDVDYYENIINVDRLDYYFEELRKQSIWLSDSFFLFGKKYFPREIAYHGEKAYTYSGKKRIPNPYSDIHKEFKEEIEHLFQLQPYNFMLLQFYQDGKHYISYHSDNETDIVTNSTIASISLGGTRTFSFRPSKKSPFYEQIQHEGEINLNLKHGDCVLMKNKTQRHWEHSIKKTSKFVEPRINITMRYIK